MKKMCCSPATAVLVPVQEYTSRQEVAHTLICAAPAAASVASSNFYGLMLLFIGIDKEQPKLVVVNSAVAICHSAS